MNKLVVLLTPHRKECSPLRLLNVLSDTSTVINNNITIQTYWNYQVQSVICNNFCKLQSFMMIMMIDTLIHDNDDWYITCGSKATNLGGVLIRGIYRHIGTTSLARHLLRSAENSVVLPDTLCGRKQNWHLPIFPFPFMEANFDSLYIILHFLLSL